MWLILSDYCIGKQICFPQNTFVSRLFRKNVAMPDIYTECIRHCVEFIDYTIVSFTGSKQPVQASFNTRVITRVQVHRLVLFSSHRVLKRVTVTYRKRNVTTKLRRERNCSRPVRSCLWYPLWLRWRCWNGNRRRASGLWWSCRREPTLIGRSTRCWRGGCGHWQ